MVALRRRLVTNFRVMFNDTSVLAASGCTAPLPFKGPNTHLMTHATKRKDRRNMGKPLLCPHIHKFWTRALRVLSVSAGRSDRRRNRQYRNERFVFACNAQRVEPKPTNASHEKHLGHVQRCACIICTVSTMCAHCTPPGHIVQRLQTCIHTPYV